MQTATASAEEPLLTRQQCQDVETVETASSRQEMVRACNSRDTVSLTDMHVDGPRTAELPQALAVGGFHCESTR